MAAPTALNEGGVTAALLARLLNNHNSAVPARVGPWELQSSSDEQSATGYVGYGNYLYIYLLIY
jgi:hypothetical protein